MIMLTDCPANIRMLIFIHRMKKRMKMLRDICWARKCYVRENSGVTLHSGECSKNLGTIESNFANVSRLTAIDCALKFNMDSFSFIGNTVTCLTFSNFV